MNGRNWNALRRYTSGSKGFLFGLLHPTDWRFDGRGCSFVPYENLAQSKQNMAGPGILLAFGSVTPTQVGIQSFSRPKYAQGIAAASITGCVSALRSSAWTSAPRPSNSHLALKFMCISTSAYNELGSAPAFYRKRRRKGKGKGAQASKIPVGDVTEEGSSKKKAEEKSVVIVESPAKARTVEKYLGEGHVVLASYGHVRDLAAKAGSVRHNDDFKLVWEVPSSARQHLNSIKTAIKSAQCLVLACDPDREGEAIAWHILEMLKLEGAVEKDLKVKRVIFNEITKTAVLHAMEAPRGISTALVDAYLARRALDYLIGFDLSPVLWRKLPGSKSAGRVQSAALRLICERETEMETFVPQEHWTIDANLFIPLKGKMSGSSTTNWQSEALFTAKVTHVDGEKLSQSSICSKDQAQAVARRVETSRFSVGSVKKSVLRRNPPAPYITSTLQQDASSKLSFGASRTMALAQQLYEGIKINNDELTGLITYMRTDSVQLSQEATQNIRSMIGTRHGDKYIPQQPRKFTSKVKNAQEAHEAIRPTDINRLPSMLVNILDEDALRLYSLIWCRTIASQMEQAIFSQVAVDITNETEDLQLRATGSSLAFPGFLAAFKDKVALTLSTEQLIGTDEWGDLSEREHLRSLEAGDLLSLEIVTPSQHFTQPPPRYTEGSLVKRLEELGIGRPSTYASTIKVLQTRNYVRIEKRRMFPESRGRMVSAFLSHYFPKFSDYDFTAQMETQLDEISAGQAEWKKVLADFWPEFHEGVEKTLNVPSKEVVELLEHVFSEQFFSGSTEKVCPSCLDGKMGLKLSRFGAGYFLGCSRYPDCLYKTNVLTAAEAESSDSSDSEIITPFYGLIKTIGVDPSSGLEVYLMDGPYGKYLQKGTRSKKQKPKRTAIPKNMDGSKLDLNEALELLKYPYELGRHPETDAPILVNTGRYGHFVRSKGAFASISSDLVPNLTVDEAVALLESKHSSKRGRRGKLEVDNALNGEAVSEKEAVAKPPVTKLKVSITVMSKKSIPAASKTKTTDKLKKILSKDTKEADKLTQKLEKMEKSLGDRPKQAKIIGAVQGRRKRSNDLVGENKMVDESPGRALEEEKPNGAIKVGNKLVDKSSGLVGANKVVDESPGGTLKEEKLNGAIKVGNKLVDKLAENREVKQKSSGEGAEDSKVNNPVNIRKGPGRPRKITTKAVETSLVQVKPR